MRVKRAPIVVRYCKRCNTSAEFVSSGCFRVNAQQKILDVWLVYNCSTCGTSWNLTVLSRITPRSISQDLLRGFYDNDFELSMRYASDIDLIKRCGAEPGQPEIEICGAEIEQTAQSRVHLITETPLDIRAENVLRKKLNISHRMFEKLLESGNLVCVSGHNLKKCKLRDEIVIELRPE